MTKRRLTKTRECTEDAPPVEGETEGCHSNSQKHVLEIADAPCGGTRLEASYDEMEIRRLGAKWNVVIKKWVVPKGHPHIEVFDRWLSRGCGKDRQTVFARDKSRKLAQLSKG